MLDKKILVCHKDLWKINKTHWLPPKGGKKDIHTLHCI